MANRSTAILLVLVAALAITCLGLIVALVARGGDHDDLDASGSGSPLGSAKRDRTPAAVEEEEEEEKYLTELWETKPRLSPNVYPMHYDLYLHPNLETDMFTGKYRSKTGASLIKTYVGDMTSDTDTLLS